MTKLFDFFLNLIRGALIGTAEVIPGISGGTVALITGVYTRIINSAAEAVRGLLLLPSFSKMKLLEAVARFRSMSWSLLIPLLVGMISAIFLSSSIVEPLLTNYPSLTKAFFAGLIAASLTVPISLSGGNWRTKEFLFFVLAAVAAFGFTSIPKASDVEPTAVAIVVSAALAVCALVLPGVSGSNLLLALGMYAPTIAAVNDLNFGYLGWFVLGAILGLGAFVRLLQWLLENRNRITMVVMAGLMLGSLRALWPWQSESGGIELPEQSFAWEVALALVGVLIIISITGLEKKLRK